MLACISEKPLHRIVVPILLSFEHKIWAKPYNAICKCKLLSLKNINLKITEF